MPSLDRFRQNVPLQMNDEKEHRRQIAQRSNIGLPLDGSKPMSYPLPLMSYTVATLLGAGDWPNSLVYVSDEAGGATLAFSDGTNWRRVQDRVIVS